MASEIALALGGGGVRGISHIGVLRCLEKEGFKIKAIAGTSVGGLLGGLYAAGVTTEELQEATYMMRQRKLFRRSLKDGPALLGLRGLEIVLKATIGDKSFKDLNIPFGCPSIDIHSGQEIILTQGKVIDAILATMAYPGVFPPKVIHGLTLVDGGVVDQFPLPLPVGLHPHYQSLLSASPLNLKNGLNYHRPGFPTQSPYRKLSSSNCVKTKLSRPLRFSLGHWIFWTGPCRSCV